MSELLQDVRFGVRTLRKGWGVTLIAIASLAVAIGGNTAVFGLIDNLLFQPLSVREPDRLVVMQERRKEAPANLSTLATSLANYADLAERSRTTTGWAAYRPTVLGMRGPDRSEPVTGAQVTTGFFDLLGVRPGRGRVFRPDEGVEGAPRVAMVTPEFWRRDHGDDVDPLGQILTLDGEPYEVVGVVPAAFTFLFINADVWVPLTESPTGSPRDRRDLVAIARLAQSATMEQVRAEMTELAGRLEAEHPAVQRDWTMDVFNARTDIPGPRSKIFYGLLQGSVFFVLLIACANITNLLMARGQERSREIALRSALGAGRGRILRQLLTESGVLVSVGALLGLVLGWYGLHLMANRFVDVLPPNYSPRLDGNVVVFTMGVSVLAGLLVGLVPAAQTFRGGHAEALKEGSGRSTGGRSRKLVTRGLVVVEIALSLLALGGGAMMVRSFLAMQRADPGFDGASILTARLRVPDSRYPTDEQRLQLLDRVLDGSRGLDGARAVAVVNVLPRNVQAPTDSFRVEGRDLDPSVSAPRAFALQASPEYADVFGIDVLQGRFFEDGDRPDQPPVVVVNRSFADKWFAGESPVGRVLQVRGAAREIVGVVADVQQVLFTTPGQVESEAIYFPAAQAPGGGYTLVVGAAGDPGALKEPLRRDLQELDPDLTLSQVLTMDEFTDQFFVGVSVFNTILGSFGILAILLASLGTYGVLAYQVSQRRHEIGIRMAVGAQAGEVVRMVTRQGVGMSALGLGIGGLVMIPLTRLVRSLLAGFVTVSADTGFVVAGILFSVTLAASLLPALRASATDPVRALRDE
jgi:putative ABC transport system permease protein